MGSTNLPGFWMSIINDENIQNQLTSVMPIHDDEEKALTLLSRTLFLIIMEIKFERDEALRASDIIVEAVNSCSQCRRKILNDKSPDKASSNSGFFSMTTQSPESVISEDVTRMSKHLRVSKQAGGTVEMESIMGETDGEECKGNIVGNDGTVREAAKEDTVRREGAVRRRSTSPIAGKNCPKSYLGTQMEIIVPSTLEIEEGKPTLEILPSEQTSEARRIFVAETVDMDASIPKDETSDLFVESDGESVDSNTGIHPAQLHDLGLTDQSPTESQMHFRSKSRGSPASKKNKNWKHLLLKSSQNKVLESQQKLGTKSFPNISGNWDNLVVENYKESTPENHKKYLVSDRNMDSVLSRIVAKQGPSSPCIPYVSETSVRESGESPQPQRNHSSNRRNQSTRATIKKRKRQERNTTRPVVDNTGISANDEDAFRPLRGSSSDIMKSQSHCVVKSPSLVSKSPSSVVKSLDIVMKSPGHVIKSPKCVEKSPSHIMKSFSHVAARSQSPIRKSPGMKSPEKSPLLGKGSRHKRLQVSETNVKRNISDSMSSGQGKVESPVTQSSEFCSMGVPETETGEKESNRRKGELRPALPCHSPFLFKQDISDDVAPGNLSSDKVASDKLIMDEMTSDNFISDNLSSDKLASANLIMDKITSENLYSDNFTSPSLLQPAPNSIASISGSRQSIQAPESTLKPANQRQMARKGGGALKRSMSTMSTFTNPRRLSLKRHQTSDGKQGAGAKLHLSLPNLKKKKLFKQTTVDDFLNQQTSVAESGGRVHKTVFLDDEEAMRMAVEESLKTKALDDLEEAQWRNSLASSHLQNRGLWSSPSTSTASHSLRDNKARPSAHSPIKLPNFRNSCFSKERQQKSPEKSGPYIKKSSPCGEKRSPQRKGIERCMKKILQEENDKQNTQSLDVCQPNTEVEGTQGKGKESTITPEKNPLKDKRQVKVQKSVFHDSFDVLPQEKEPNFAYQGKAERKKAARKQLQGFSCKACEDFYKKSTDTTQESKELMNMCSRHRSKYKPVSSTPKGFWNPMFDD